MNTPGPATLVALTLALVGCQERVAAPASPATAPAPASAPAAAPSPAPGPDRWLGQWNGPEGTLLKLEGGNGQYTVTVRNLDGPRSFAGTAAGERVEFERDGVKESVRASNGAETGMKWLAEKSDCLTVRTGEGYCRD